MRKLTSLALRQKGVSLVELLVGATAGLVVIAGALSLFATSVQSTRRTVADTRLQQDLRLIADLITRDIRRSGYWGDAPLGTFAKGSSTSRTEINPYREISPTVSLTAGSIDYAFSRDEMSDSSGADVDDQVKSSSETFGFLLDEGTVYMNTGSGGVQALNDANYSKVTVLSVADASPNRVWLGARCETVKMPLTPNSPFIYVRNYDISITGVSALDPTVVRTLKTSVRVRNNRIEGDCDV